MAINRSSSRPAAKPPMPIRVPTKTTGWDVPGSGVEVIRSSATPVGFESSGNWTVKDQQNSAANNSYQPPTTTTTGTGASPSTIPSTRNSGYGKLIASQLAGINRGDPGRGGSLTEQELRQTAMRRLGG
jgi:hypothetical protein